MHGYHVLQLQKSLSLLLINAISLSLKLFKILIKGCFLTCCSSCSWLCLFSGVEHKAFAFSQSLFWIIECCFFWILNGVQMSALVCFAHLLLFTVFFWTISLLPWFFFARGKSTLLIHTKPYPKHYSASDLSSKLLCHLSCD